MAIALRSSSHVQLTGVVPKPTGTASGDVMVATVATNGAPTPPAGWTQQAQANYSTLYLTHYTRVAGGSEGSSYTWTAATSVLEAGIDTRTGVDTTTPITGTPTQNSAFASSATPGSITTGAANALLVMGGFGYAPASDGTGLSWSGSGAELWEENYVNTYFLDAQDETIASAGATGSRTVTLAGTLGSGSGVLGVMLALKPGSTSTPATVNAVVSTESATAPAPTLSAASKVTGVVATLSAQMPAPAPKAASLVAGTVATLSAQAFAPTVGVFTTVTGVVATLSAQAFAPTVGVFTTVTVNAVVATENSAALAPTLKTAARVTGVAATLSALMPVPTVSGQQPATVTAITATEQAQMFAPTFAVKARVTAVVATESAQMFAPSIGIPTRVSVPLATLTQQAFAPVVTSKVVVAAPAATLALAASLPAVSVGFVSPELVTTMPNKAHTLTWTDGAWPDLSQALVGVTVSPGFDALVFDAYVQDNTTVVLDLSASDAATLNAGRIAPYQITADFDDRRALVLAQGLWADATPGTVVYADDLRHTQTITQGTAATLTWSDPGWPALDHVLVTVVIGAGRNERRYEAAIDAGDVVTLNLTATGAQLDPGVYSYEVRADFDTTGLYQLATGLLAVNAA